MSREIIGVGLTLLIAIAGAIFYVGGLNERVKVLEKASIPEEKIKAINEMRGIIEKFKTTDKRPTSTRIEVQGGGTWGDWHDVTYCPTNYYVCGLEQKVENPLGNNGDDTALNQVALRCCRLF